MKKLETTILKNLIQEEEYARKVLPFLNDNYFSEKSERIVFKQIKEHIIKYNNTPTAESLHININALDNLREDEVKSALTVLTSIEEIKDEKSDQSWLIDKTEKFCQEKAIYNAVLESIGILDKTSKSSKDKGAIPQILSDALAVSFDNHVGHDYFDDADSRFDFYHRTEKRIPFDLDYFNKITKGGLPTKTLNIFIAGTGVGKSLAMCHIAASFMVQGYNVLYITLEMAEERIAERIDANLLNVSLDDLLKLPKDMYDKKIERVRKNTTGKLKIKEYPTASAGSIHFRNLLNELALKKSFRPDVIFVDYLNICSSSRIKAGSNVNSYTYVKAIAEELRGLAVEFKVPLISATQTTRSGYSSTDVELTDTSECIWVEEKVTMIDGSIKTMEEIVPGDQIIANDGYKTTLFVHHKKPKDCVKVTLKSGKSIIVSKDHVFPTSSGRKSVNDGLKIGDILHSL